MPFSSYQKPLFQSEANCKALDYNVRIIFYFHANELTHFNKKGCPLSLVLKVRVLGTGKWSTAFFSVSSDYIVGNRCIEIGDHER